jgi:biopolymer transport protein TolR
MTARLEVDLPKTSQAPSSVVPQRVLRITITREGRVKVGGKEVVLEHLKTWLKEAKERKLIRGVEIEADKRCPYGVVARVLALIKEAGFEGVDLLTIPAGS